MSTGFSHKHNTDDVHLRSVIVGLVNTLNNEVTIKNVVSDTEVKIVKVPFFYAFSGDEKFMQDYFTNWSDCAPDFIEGNYDPIPRGNMTMTGINILNANQTSRFVRGYYTKEVEGQLVRYNSYLNSIPMSLRFNMKVLVDSVLDAFKINQEIIRIFYKTMVFRVNFAGSVIPCQVGFPEDYTVDKQFEYTYGDQLRTTLSFDLEVETYLPIFDAKNEMFAGSKIENFGIGVTAMPRGASSQSVQSADPAGPIGNPSPPFFLKHDPNNAKFDGDYWQ